MTGAAIMVVNLDTPAQMAELMYALTWFSGSEPTFTLVMKPEVYGEAIANAKRIICISYDLIRRSVLAVRAVVSVDDGHAAMSFSFAKGSASIRV